MNTVDTRVSSVYHDSYYDANTEKLIGNWDKRVPFVVVQHAADEDDMTLNEFENAIGPALQRIEVLSEESEDEFD